jgi:hypothetical protein
MDFLNSEIPVNESASESVRNFTDAIIKSVKSKNKLIDLEVSYEDALKSNNEEKSIKSRISTKYGLVHVYPDFRTNSAQALIVNRGLIYSMLAEGFENEKINESKVYGTPFFISDEKVNLLGSYLTKDLGLQHQKGWELREFE